MAEDQKEEKRDIVFISKATPGDDEFVMWLAPRIEAAGYKVFADILTLEPGDRWRKEITATLQNKSIKMLLCCSDSTLARNGVQEEIGIALDLARELGDEQFIIPMRLEKYKKLFGIGELQYINFENRWAQGLSELLEALKKQNVPCEADVKSINPNWEVYRSRFSIDVEETSEALTSNWLEINTVPDKIYYYQPTGALDHPALQQACNYSHHPVILFQRGFLTFMSLDEVNEKFSSAARFKVTHELPLLKFIEDGCDELEISARDAKNKVTDMFRKAWENFCREKKLLQYAYSNKLGFHASEDFIELGKKVSWGERGAARSSMLRNIKSEKVWQFGVSAIPSLWPFPHFRLKSRVLFSECENGKAGKPFSDSLQQHRLRRRLCKGWRNNRWHGCLMALLKALSEGRDTIEIAMSKEQFIEVKAKPMSFMVPVTTVLPQVMQDEDEEGDESTFGNEPFEMEETGT